MAFPRTFAELKTAGYRFDNHARCRSCEQEIEWWLTPKGRRMPLNLMHTDDSPAVSHFATCAEADSWRQAR